MTKVLTCKLELDVNLPGNDQLDIDSNVIALVLPCRAKLAPLTSFFFAGTKK